MAPPSGAGEQGDQRDAVMFTKKYRLRACGETLYWATRASSNFARR